MSGRLLAITKELALRMPDSERKGLSETMVIAGLTALSYVVAGVYESAYARVFGIPTELIQIELSVVLKSFAAIASGWVCILFVMNIVVGVLDKGVITFTGRLIAIALIPALILGTGVLGIVGLDHWKGVLLFVVAAALSTTGISYAVPMLFYPKHLTYQAKYEAHEAELKAAPDLAMLVDRHFGTHGLIIIVAAGLSILFASLAGTFDARDREVFLQPQQSRSEVVLRIYDNNAVVAAFDVRSRTILPRYRILTLGDSSLVLRSMTVGKVKMAHPGSLP